MEGNVSITGVAGTAGVIIGGAIVENTILGAHFYAVALPNPTVSRGSQSVSSSNTWLSLFGFGPSVTHYFMPANIYLTGTVAVTRLSLTVNGTTVDANTGYGFRPAIGKEWWVSNHWGLGVSGHLTFSANQDTGNNAPIIVSWFFGLAFSATYN